MSYVRCGILGSAPGGEVWSVNPVFDPTGEISGPVDQTKLDSAANAIAALSPGTNLRSMWSTSLALTGVRLEVRDDSTDALLGISIQVRSPALTGSGTPARGPDDALVFSLRTNTPGASGRGRMYWPNIAGTVGSDLRMSSSVVTTALGEMATYLHSIEDALATAFPTVGFDLAVRSKTTHTTPHVNKLMAGTVIDNQRRRRDKLVEDYSSVAF